MWVITASTGKDGGIGCGLRLLESVKTQRRHWAPELEFTDRARHHTVVEIFEILTAIEDVETIAVEGRIRDIERLRKLYGSGRWRKLKGTAIVRLEDGFESRAELHWYEAHGIGKKEIKIKELLD